MTTFTSKKVTIVGVLGSDIFKSNQDYAESNPHNTQMILEADQAKKLDSAKNDVLKEAFDGKSKTVKTFLLQKGEDEQYEHTFGKHFLNCRSKKPIDCYLKQNGTLVKLSEDAAREYFYRGAIVALSLSVQYRPTFTTAQGKIPEHIGSKPIGLMFVKHGTRLSDDNIATASDFGDIESDLPKSDTQEIALDDDTLTF